MRTTLRIQDDLLRELKERARRERGSVTSVVNTVLRIGLRALQGPPPRPHPFREPPCDLGAPQVDLDRALQVAVHLEDEETLHKLSLRK